MRALFVSPHLDDVALSCGGLVAAIGRRGGHLALLTVFAGDEPPSPAPIAAEQHARWGLDGVSGGVVRARRSEDVEAARILGAVPTHLAFREATYRRSDGAGDTEPRVRTHEDLFTPPGPGDRELAVRVGEDLAAAIEREAPTHVFAPAAVGSHIDHVITRMAAEAAARTTGLTPPLLYEDVPYATTVRGAPALAELPRTAIPLIWELAPDDWHRKVSAIEAYASQVDTLWSGRDWRAVLHGHADGIAKGRLVERTWLRV